MSEQNDFGERVPSGLDQLWAPTQDTSRRNDISERVTHRVVSSSRYCQRSTCGKRGVDDGIRGGSKDYTADVPELLGRIRERLVIPASDASVNEDFDAMSDTSSDEGLEEEDEVKRSSHAIRHSMGHSRFHKRRISASRA